MISQIKNSPIFRAIYQPFGGTYESRTRLKGFADLCVTDPPTRHHFHYIRFYKTYHEQIV